MCRSAPSRPAAPAALPALAERDSGLSELAGRLTHLAMRLSRAPIGVELAEIAARMQERATEGPGSALELVSLVSRLQEEREELRNAFAAHLIEADRREADLRAECVRLEDEIEAQKGGKGCERCDRLKAEHALARQEEATASRTARAALVAENSVLRSELASERVTTRALRAEVAAARTLRKDPASPGLVTDRTTETSGPAAKAHPAGEEPPVPEAAASGADPTSVGQARQPEQDPASPRGRRRSSVPDGGPDGRPKRNFDFAQRDFAAAAVSPEPEVLEVKQVDYPSWTPEGREESAQKQVSGIGK